VHAARLVPQASSVTDCRHCNRAARAADATPLTIVSPTVQAFPSSYDA
jgi:hypothetical protein